jgi:putative membrane protein
MAFSFSNLSCAVFAAAALYGATSYALSTQEFVKEATRAHRFEVESSQLALKKSHDPEVKAFAKKVLEESQANHEVLKSAVKGSDVTISESAKLDGERQMSLDILKDSEREFFDSEFTEVQSDAQKETAALFEDYLRQGDDPALKNYASQTLPLLKQQSRRAEKLAEGQ